VNYLSIAILGLLSGTSVAQCITGSPGTNCSGPLSVQPPAGNAAQSAITFVDLGLTVPAPAAGQYILSIGGGMLLESDDGNGYHSLVGAPGLQGETGPTGARGPKGVPGPIGAQGLGGTMAAPSDYSFSGWGSFSAAAGTSEVGNSLYRNQIDMANAAAVRLVLTLGMYALPSGSYAQAEYSPDGTAWIALSGTVPVTAPFGIYNSGWQGLPGGANGDYVVRIVTFNSASGTTQCSLYQLHLQFK
jgi:hypothetical protein